MYGRTDTKSPMASSSMVHVAGGEGGSIRHDDDGRPARSGGDMNRLRDLTAELRFMPATTDAAAIDGRPMGAVWATLPYVWTKTAEQILASTGNYCTRING